MKILGLCGSIRRESSNQAILNAMKDFSSLATAWTNFEIKSLPYFDPTLQFGDHIPPEVAKLREIAKHADVIVISTPEYAHGIPGILKNALEWLVCEETLQKKVAVVIATSSGGTYVKEHLAETLRTMDMLTSDELTLTIRSARKDIADDGRIVGAELNQLLFDFLRKFCDC